MEQPRYTDKDVVYQIGKILVHEITHYKKPEELELSAAIEQIVDQGTAPLMTYAALASALNLELGMSEAANKFTALNIDVFLGMLLKESIDYSYKIDGVSHIGKIRKKLERDIPITAIVVNAKTHLPGKKFFTYFDLPYATDAELRASTLSLLHSLLTFPDWDEYRKRLEKVFGGK